MEVTLDNDSTILVRRRPAPNGGFIASQTDITESKRAERELARSRALLDGVVENSDALIYAKDLEGRYILVNRRWENLTKVPRVEALNHDDFTFFTAESAEEFRANDAKVIAGGKTLTTEENVATADGAKIYLSSKFPLSGEDGEVMGICGISTDIHERKLAEQALADAYEVISDSIRYASRIQRALLPPEHFLTESLADHFIIWEPRDEVGGDMYWYRQCENGFLILLADCTGHGVPGAFMTMIASGALDRAMREHPDGDPAAVLHVMNRSIKRSLNQDTKDGESDDGMDIGVCRVEPEAGRLVYAGAKFSLFRVNGEDVEEIKGDKASVGYRKVPLEQSYANHEIAVAEGDCFFLSTDGLTDQVGGPKRRMFGKKRVKDLLLELAGRPMPEQRDRLYQSFVDYQGEQIRRDDLSVFGFRL